MLLCCSLETLLCPLDLPGHLETRIPTQLKSTTSFMNAAPKLNTAKGEDILSNRILFQRLSITKCDKPHSKRVFEK